MKARITFYLLIMSAFGISNTVLAWQRKIINYERNIYKAGFQNWHIEQTKQSIMYFANSEGLLEFDGTNWELYPVKNKIIRTVKTIDSKIYVGGSSEFGYFEENEMGILTYHSLSDKVGKWGGEIWNIVCVDNTIYFVDEMSIITYTPDGTIKKIGTASKIDCSTVMNKRLYVGSKNGISYLDNNKLVYLETSKIVDGAKIVGMIPYNNELMVVTAHAGIFAINNNVCRKLNLIPEQIRITNQFFCAAISMNKIALGSVQHGIYILDMDNPTAEIEQFNLNNGLKNNTVLSCFFDRQHGLWLGLDKGIAYIDLASPLRPLFAKDSPIGTGYCSQLFNNELYLGTNQGLYKMDKQEDCHLVANSEGQVWSLLSYDNLLFSAGDNHITVISPTQTYSIDVRGVWEIHPIKGNKERLIAGLYNGFAILEKKNGRWQLAHTLPQLSGYSGKGFIEDDVANVFWVATPEQDITKIYLNDDLTEVIKVKNYSLKGKHIGRNIYFRKIDNIIAVCGENGIYQYNHITDRFIPYPQLESLLDGKKYYEYLSVDKLKNIWYISDKNLKFVPSDDNVYSKRTIDLNLNDELIDNYQNVSIIDSATAIISVDNSFIKVNLKKLNSICKLNVSIRRLKAGGNDSILIFGKTASKIILPYSQNNVNISFATTQFSKNEKIVYSYRLKGVGEKWSTPSSQPFKEYTNLHEGDYTLEVKAYMKGNQQSENIASISFSILPPWYRSTWAYISYLFLFVILLYTMYKKTVSKQKDIVRQKKEELIKQNLLHEEENRKKDNEIYILQNENLKAELHYKTHELTGYILNVIKKNETLESIKKSAQGIAKAIDEQKAPNILRQRAVRLITHINNSIEQDSNFKVFESNFNAIHHDFLRLLDEKYPQLTRGDKILCAYLKMNFSSKEIAPLLNISVRGVEISRYRLRKKMNLGREINLSEFMQNL